MRRLLRRLVGWPVMLVLLGAVVALAASGGAAQAQPGGPEPPWPPVPPDVSSSVPPPAGTPTEVARGRTLYLYYCATCHGQGAEGSHRGPTLIGVGEAATDFYLRTGRMPLNWEKVQNQAPRRRPLLSPSEITALDAYVGSLVPIAPPATPGSVPLPAPVPERGPAIPTVGPGDLTQGRKLYLQYCAACHAPSGIGYQQLSGLVAPSLLYDNALEVAEAIRVGPNLMPQFPESVFTQDQLNSLASYVEYLQVPRVGGQGGAQIGRIGAAVEALVAFAAVVLLMIPLRLLGKRSAEKRRS